MPDPWKAQRDARLAAEDAMRRAVEEEAGRVPKWLADQIKGEKGDPGERGERGEMGDPGEPGAPGRRGERGEPGEPGLPGENGVNGRDGRDGRDGANGKDGRHGLDGAYTIRSEFKRDDSGQRIEAVVEYLSNGNTRTLTVQRDSSGRPTGLE